ncbi:nitrous oxide reductase accessory protein NosL [Shinella yambaruensis]|uniref:NosL copper chaperone n=1 Tax=Shinella yambaruensis TaxID=415996 RepID=A0ABQ5ZKV0_9HYPH|nr:nitrous oxide reductase accessory protein NosL [Shinella yambaruensis]MCJ8027399.1 nitrous oxide reductase accessory protein NosL [Shinella yambaruensis]MCU7983282.1 nitrous oxide reductase accessory protein NosL [Shinella yambaruensis]GLR52384.1 NosL copper chaperone [Shinella yambaruensis]
MKRMLATLVLVLVAGCSEQPAEVPQPFALTEEAIGRYCGMNVLEHEGPKGQIILSQIPEPIWFSSARDAVAFTLLPDEPKAIAAIYVSDMGTAASWAQPGAENWIDARTAFYVIGSAQRGGMGVAETIPFSRETDARDFAGKHGGEVVGFSDIPPGYVLGDGQTADGAAPQRQEEGQ